MALYDILQGMKVGQDDSLINTSPSNTTLQQKLALDKQKKIAGLIQNQAIDQSTKAKLDELEKQDEKKATAEAQSNPDTGTGLMQSFQGKEIKNPDTSTSEGIGGTAGGLIGSIWGPIGQVAGKEAGTQVGGSIQEMIGSKQRWTDLSRRFINYPIAKISNPPGQEAMQGMMGQQGAGGMGQNPMTAMDTTDGSATEAGAMSETGALSDAGGSWWSNLFSSGGGAAGEGMSAAGSGGGS